MATKTNLESKFSPFSFNLNNGTTVTGIAFVPRECKSSPKPLLVGIHGGTCTSQNYDVNPDYTASIYATKHRTPFVAIDRPCYGGSTFVLPLPESDSFYNASANQLHDFVLPEIWKQFGIPNNCSTMVTTSHSMAVPVAIITAASYATTAPKYPLAGIILSGFGTRPRSVDFGDVNMTDVVIFPRQVKRYLMLSEDQLHCADPALYPLVDQQTVPMPMAESKNLRSWPGYASQIMQKVEVPILSALGEHDWLLEATEDAMEEYMGQFRKCAKFEGVVFKGAPHALEWSYKSKEWYEKCFTWAQDIASRSVSHSKI